MSGVLSVYHTCQSGICFLTVYCMHTKEHSTAQRSVRISLFTELGRACSGTLPFKGKGFVQNRQLYKESRCVQSFFFFSQKLLKVTIISFTHQKTIYIFIKSGVIVYNIM